MLNKIWKEAEFETSGNWRMDCGIKPIDGDWLTNKDNNCIYARYLYKMKYIIKCKDPA